MEPYPFQSEDLDQIDAFRGRALVAWQMGLGKSAESLWYAERHGAFPLVVVCPASVKWQWQAEAMKVLRIRAAVCEGQRPRSVEGDKVVIINYDILRFWLDELRQLGPAMVVVDECHYCQNLRAKRTKAVKELVKRCRQLLMLSGTPLINRPIELFPTLQMLRPTIFSSRFAFGMEYCAGKRGYRGWDFSGASKSKQLNRLLLDTCMVRRRKADVLKDLPDKTRQVVPVDLRDQSEYLRAEKDFLVWLRRQDPAAAERAKRAEAITKVGYLLRLAAKLKCRACYGWINEWIEESGEKLVVFAVHRKMVEALKRNCKAESVVVDGSVTGKDRRHAVNQFRKDPRTRLFLGNVQAAGVGVDGLQEASSSVAFVELPWQPGAVVQAEARLDRLGQRQGVNVYYLVAHETVEEQRAAIIGKKQEVLTAVLDGDAAEDLDVFDDFLKEMKRTME